MLGGLEGAEARMSERILCVFLPSFVLQIEGRTLDEDPPPAMVVVESERPSARVLELNEVASRAGVRRGMRYGDVLSFVPALRASVYDAGRVAASADSLARSLERFSPLVEMQGEFPGVFWLQGRGLASLWASASAWTQAVHTELGVRGYASAVVCGFTRFGTMALARAWSEGARVLVSLEQERGLLERVPLDASGFAPSVRDDFERLGIRTMGGLRSLPVGAVQLRYGEQSAALVRLAREERTFGQRVWTPAPDFEARAHLDEPLRETSALLFRVRALVESVCEQLEARALSAAQMTLTLALDWPKLPDEALLVAAARAGVEPQGAIQLQTRPARASVDVTRWMELFRLRFERLSVPLGVQELRLRAQAVREQAEQLAVPSVGESRDPGALLEAIAKMRAEFGEDAVGVLERRPAHLPQARQGWTPVTTLCAPSPAPETPLSLSRRLWPQPQEVGGQLRAGPPGSRDDPPPPPPLYALGYGEVVHLRGPWVVAGGWWRREVIREEYYVETSTGALLWMYWDRMRGRWFIQGDLA